jgi:hypothetical protein
MPLQLQLEIAKAGEKLPPLYKERVSLQADKKEIRKS